MFDEIQRQSEKERVERLSMFVGGLETEAKRRVDRRAMVEQRWIEDLRQYHGLYSKDLLEKLKRSKGSTVFLNLTRPKTNAMMARLWDLLFPTDDRNWGIQPTPVPDMYENAEEAAKLADEAEATFSAHERELRDAEAKGDEGEEDAQRLAAEMEEIEDVRNKAQEAADQLHEVLNEAKRRCNLMQEEIEDQLVTCSYQAAARDAIEDACKIGTGILKGPVIGSRAKRKWAAVETDDGVFELQTLDDRMPAIQRVSPWGFFPDPDARTPEESEGFFERHLMNNQQMRKLAKRRDIDSNVVRELLREGPRESGYPAFMIDLHDLTNQQTSAAKDVFHVWEYTGPIDSDDLMNLLQDIGKEDMRDDIAEDADDPLIEMHVKIWFSQGQVLSVAMHPLDSCEPIYSVFNIERDETSMFGFGIPYLMRDDQSVLNGAQRMMMDNAGLSVGPQIVVNKKVVTPEDGSYNLAPRKIWIRNEGDADPRTPAFETYDVPMHQQELQNLIGMSRQAIDEVTSMPQIAQGEQGTGVTKTAQGMALLMNSANVVFRRVIKNFDDDITIPIIRRLYDWNMQFSKKSEIKGDFDVDARGSSVLLVREMQANNLMLIAERFSDHPIYGTRLKHNELFKQVLRAHQIPADEILLSEREAEKKEAEALEKQQNDPAIQVAQEANELKKQEIAIKERELDSKVQMHNAEWSARRDIAEMQFDGQMGRHVEDLNARERERDDKASDRARAEAIRAEASDRKIQSDERKLATEVAMAQRTGQSAGGSV